MTSVLFLIFFLVIDSTFGEIESIGELDTSIIESKSIARPKWAGPVHIHHYDHEIHSVEAILIPMKTGGRSKPPSPLFGKIAEAQSKKLDKGHVIALQLGGPDISENIVAQNSAWNAYGAWRHLEKYLLHLTRSVMGFNKTEPEFSYYNDPNDFYPPKFCVKYLVMPSDYNDNGEPDKYIGSISIMHQPIHSKASMWIEGVTDHLSSWMVAEHFNFTIKPGKDAKWTKSKKPFDWISYKAPSAEKKALGPVWKHFGAETESFIEMITGNNPVTKAAVRLRRVIHVNDDQAGGSVQKEDRESSDWLETTITVKMVLLWNSLFVVVFILLICFRGKIKKIVMGKFTKIIS